MVFAERLLFFASNLVIVSGYLTASLLISRRKGPAAQMSRVTWFAGLSFFALCGLTHIELALHGLFEVPMVAPENGAIPWHVMLVHIPQAVSIWAFLWTIQRQPGESRPLPLEGAAVPDKDP